MLAASKNVVQVKKQSFRTRLMTWRALSISPCHRGALGVRHWVVAAVEGDERGIHLVQPLLDALRAQPVLRRHPVAPQVDI